MRRSLTWSVGTLCSYLDKVESNAGDGKQTKAVSMGTGVQLCAADAET